MESHPKRAPEISVTELQHLRLLIDSLPDYMYLKDTEGRFLLINRAEARLLGLADPKDAIGKTDFDFSPTERAAQYQQDEQAIHRTRQPLINHEEPVVDSKGHTQWVQTTKVPLLDPAGNITAIVGMSRDITPLKRSRDDLHRMKEDLERCVTDQTLELFKTNAQLKEEIENQKHIRTELQASELLYRTLAESAQDFIYILGRDGRIEYMNRFALQEFGLDPETSTGRRLSDFLPTEVALHLQNTFHTVFAGGAVQHSKDPIALPTRQVWLDSMFVPLRNPDQSIRGVLVVARDVTEQDHARTVLEDVIKQLQDHDRNKSQFVANVSHELKTPLTSMAYAVHNLLLGIHGPLPEEVVKYLKMFAGECQRMLKTVNDILDLRKIETRTLVLAKVRLPIGRLISRHSVEPLRDQAEAKSVTLTVTLDPAIGAVNCDPEKIERVLQNLIGNALKYTPAGGHIRIKVLPDPDSQAMTLIQVEDDGSGIPPAALNRVTEFYFRADDHVSGSGLGLALSKQIVDLHGGSLQVQSPPPDRPHGTLASVRLPTAEPPRVLVVDDDPLIRQLLEVQLGDNGYHVFGVANAREALVLANQNPPDVLITDLILQDMSGDEMILQLKDQARFHTLPIIAISGGNIDESKFRVLSGFTVPILHKPWREAEILEIVENALIGSTIFRKEDVDRTAAPLSAQPRQQGGS